MAKLTPDEKAKLRLQSLPRATVQADGACVILDISRPTFERHVKPHLRVIREGSVRLYLISELFEWAEKNAHRTLEDAA